MACKLTVEEPLIAKEHDMIHLNGECIAIMDNGNVAMRLLSAAWQQMPQEEAQLCQKGAATYQLQDTFPFQNKCTMDPLCISSLRSSSTCNKSVKPRVGVAPHTGVGSA